MKKNLKYLLLLATISFLYFSCIKNGPRHVTCAHSIYYFSYGFAFQNYTPDELDTLVLNTYTKGSNFQTLLNSETLFVNNVNYRQGIAVKDSTKAEYFFEITEGKDFRLFITSTQDVIDIKNVRKGPTVATFQMEDHCSPGSYQPQFTVFLSDFNTNNSHLSISMKHNLCLSYANDWCAIISK